MRIAFVTNLPSHYLRRLFETIAAHFDVTFFFYSLGKEKWLERRNSLEVGSYTAIFVRGISIVKHVRINFKLALKLFTGRYDIYIQYINGPVEILVSFLTSRIRRKPFILWTDLWFHPDSLFHKLSFPVVNFIYHHSDAIAVWGTHVARYLISLGVDERRIFYSWGSVDNELFSKPVSKVVLEELNEKFNVESNAVILFVGRLSPEKGVIYLLEAMKKLPADLKPILLVIGDGVEKKTLVSFVQREQLQRVHFIGYVPNDQLSPFYALADLLVLPSVRTKTMREVWGLVINEAMSQGCAVVTTDIVGAAIGGLVDDGINGLVVPERDPTALANAIEGLLRNPEKLAEMGRHALKKVKTWDHMRAYRGFRDAIDFVWRS